MITFQSENGKNQLSIVLQDFLHANFSDYYVRIAAYLSNNTLKQHLIRKPLKTIERDLYTLSEIQRTHRTYLINKINIDSIKQQKRRLSLDIRGNQIPVSKKFENLFCTQLIYSSLMANIHPKTNLSNYIIKGLIEFCFKRFEIKTMKQLFYFLLSIQFLIACNSYESKRSGSKLTERMRQIAGLINQYHSEDRFHGEVVISHFGEFIYKSYLGRAARTWNIPFDNDIKMDIASLNKSMITALILKAEK